MKDTETARHGALRAVAEAEVYAMSHPGSELEGQVAALRKQYLDASNTGTSFARIERQAYALIVSHAETTTATP